MLSDTILNLTIKKLGGEASAAELLQLQQLVENDTTNALFVNTLSDYFNQPTDEDKANSERLFKSVKQRIAPEG
jgi:hypothetical protein